MLEFKSRYRNSVNFTEGFYWRDIIIIMMLGYFIESSLCVSHAVVMLPLVFYNIFAMHHYLWWRYFDNVFVHNKVELLNMFYVVLVCVCVRVHARVFGSLFETVMSNIQRPFILPFCAIENGEIGTHFWSHAKMAQDGETILASELFNLTTEREIFSSKQ